MGIMLVYYQVTEPDSSDWSKVALSFDYPYFSISLALNVLLTLMIIIRLILHRRNIRNAMGTPTGAGGLYNAVITMLIESSALYAVCALVFVGPWGAGGYVTDVFSPILGQTQVCAVLMRSRSTTISGCCYLIILTNRLLLRCSSSYESLTRAH